MKFLISKKNKLIVTSFLDEANLRLENLERVGLKLEKQVRPGLKK
jgi:hypothetical protein